jgi:ligand-binding sensor domain-containing protein
MSRPAFVLILLTAILSSCAPASLPQTPGAKATNPVPGVTYQPVSTSPPQTRQALVMTATSPPAVTIPTLPATPIPAATSTSLPSLPSNNRRGWTSYTNGNYVKDLVFDRDGMLWVASAGGVVRWDLESHESVQYHAEDGLASNRVFSAARDADGKLWFGTDAGVSRFDGANWTTFSSSNGLIDNEVDAIEADKDGSIWFGTPLGCFSVRWSKMEFFR